MEKRLKKRNSQKLADDEMAMKDFEVVNAPAKVDRGSSPGSQGTGNKSPALDEAAGVEVDPKKLEPVDFPEKFENRPIEKPEPDPEVAKPETEEDESDERPDFEMIGSQSDKSDKTDPDMVKVSHDGDAHDGDDDDGDGSSKSMSSTSSHSSHRGVEDGARRPVFQLVDLVGRPDLKLVETSSSTSSTDTDEEDGIGFSKFEKIRRKFQRGSAAFKNRKTGQTGSSRKEQDEDDRSLPDDRGFTEEVPEAFEVFPPKYSEVSIEVGPTDLDAEAEGSRPMSVELVPQMNRLRSSFHNMVIIPIKEN